MQLAFGKDFFKQVNKLRNLADQSAVNACIQKFQDNPANPGISLERVDRSRDPNVWAARANRDVRIIIHKSSDIETMLYVGHHDDAYRWAKDIKVESNSMTGNLQVVHVEEVWNRAVRKWEVVPERTPLFASHNDDYLLSLGVPPDALAGVRQITDEDQLLEVARLLPEAVWERLILLSWGEHVAVPEPVGGLLNPIDGADAQRDFFLIEKDEDLERVLSSSWEEWVIFLHPDQKTVAHGKFSGPCRITGTAGTGKTVVAMHRARHLAHQGHHVLLTTFTGTLASNLRQNLERLCTPLELSRITVSTVHSAALDVLRKAGGYVDVLGPDVMKKVLAHHAARTGCSYSSDFLLAEWERIIVAQAIMTWDDYRVAQRLGRGTPLQVAQRKQLWEVFQAVRSQLEADHQADWSDSCRIVRRHLESGQAKSPYDAVVVDEVQDLGPQEILVVKALAGAMPDSLTVTGDAGQRIYPGGFSLSALGIETRGRSHVLRVCYRTSHEIRRCADRLLGDVCDDLDGGKELRGGVISRFRGPGPEICGYRNADDQADAVANLVHGLIEEGREPGSIGIFARDKKEFEPIEHALNTRQVRRVRIRKKMSLADLSEVRLGTMHSAKGLEFRSVFVLSVNDGVLPHPNALAAEDPADVEQAKEHERQVLYVSMTRAREELRVCYYGRPSPFLVEAGLIKES